VTRQASMLHPGLARRVENPLPAPTGKCQSAAGAIRTHKEHPAMNTPATRSEPVLQPTASAKAPHLWRAGAAASVAAAVATESLAAIGRAAGVPMLAGAPWAPSATKIAVLTTGLTTLVCAAIGTVLAVALARWARRPARTFTVSTVALTVLSLVDPVLAADTAPATKITLASAHLLAAAIVIPALARQLPRTGRDTA
jgi:hypothetical protein